MASTSCPPITPICVSLNRTSPFRNSMRPRRPSSSPKPMAWNRRPNGKGSPRKSGPSGMPRSEPPRRHRNPGPRRVLLSKERPIRPRTLQAPRVCAADLLRRRSSSRKLGLPYLKQPRSRPSPSILFRRHPAPLPHRTDRPRRCRHCRPPMPGREPPGPRSPWPPSPTPDATRNGSGFRAAGWRLPWERSSPPGRRNGGPAPHPPPSSTGKARPLAAHPQF